MRKLAAHLLGALLLATSSIAQATTETIIHRFAGGAQDGEAPQGKLGIDRAGAIYGSTRGGGLQSCRAVGRGCGVIFKLKPPTKAGGAWPETLIYKFTGGTGGYSPTTGVIVDSFGDIFATGQIASDNGVVFSLAPTNFRPMPWQSKLLITGVNPSNFTFGSGGLYGVGTSGSNGTGAVFAVSLMTGQAPIIYTLSHNKGDGLPAGSLVVTGGSIFGTTATGGKAGASLGTAFELAAPTTGFSRRQSTIYSFPGALLGSDPVTGLIAGSAGNLYGATAHGGAAGAGVIFRLSRPKPPSKVWKETVLYSFGNDGYPQGDLIFVKGVLYGTTGGDTKHNRFGEVFKLTPPAAGQKGWRYTVLHKFTGGLDGALPRGDLVADAKGTLYGTTASGGGRGTCRDGSAKGCGTVFKINP